MNRRYGFGFLLVVLLAVGSALPGPHHEARARRPGRFLGSARIDPATRGVIRRACGDCHSAETRWPWYSHIAPASWMVERDVAMAREFLNFSLWEQYGEATGAVLERIRDRVAEGSMPPRRYRLLHPEAALSNAGRKRIADWTESEIARLRRGGKPAW